MGVMGAAFLSTGLARVAFAQESVAVQETNAPSDSDLCRANLQKIYEAIKAYEKAGFRPLLLEMRLGIE